MIVGLLQLHLRIPEARSLKDKRRSIKSIKDRLGSRHNVSVAEIGHLDDPHSCIMGLAMVSNDRRFTESCLSKIVDEVRLHHTVQLIDYELEFV